MASLKPLPHPSVPLVDVATGRINEDWFRYFQSRERVGTTHLFDVSPTAPTNGQVLVFNSTTGKYEPGSN